MSNRHSPHYAARRAIARDNIRRHWDDLILPSSSQSFDLQADIQAQIERREFAAFKSVYGLFTARKSDH